MLTEVELLERMAATFWNFGEFGKEGQEQPKWEDLSPDHQRWVRKAMRVASFDLLRDQGFLLITKASLAQFVEGREFPKGDT